MVVKKAKKTVKKPAAKEQLKELRNQLRDPRKNNSLIAIGTGRQSLWIYSRTESLCVCGGEPGKDSMEHDTRLF